MTVPIKIALHDEDAVFSLTELSDVAAAVNQQLGDLVHAWSLHAYAFQVIPVPGPPVPGTWTVHLVKDVGDPGALGYHSDQHRQPYAMVDGSQAKDQVTVTISHETLEMALDPFGKSLHAAAPPAGWPGKGSRVRYLREACDPVETVVYATGGIDVSDFLLPAYYRTSKTGRGSFHAGIAPRTVLDGGYVSLLDPQTGDWWQCFVQGVHTKWENLGPDTGEHASLREFTDAHARRLRTGGSKGRLDG